MADLNGHVAIITGASSGIGEATAVRLAKSGAKVTLAARREDRLNDLAKKVTDAGAEALVCVTDVTDRDQVQAMADATIAKWGHVDTLVANAGVMPLSPLAKGKVDEWDLMIDVNIKGLLYSIHSVLGHMMERESGHVINVSSIAGHLVFPAAAVYCSTKHAVRAISEGLRRESVGKLRVTNISPGAVATELPDIISDEDVKGMMGEVYQIAIDSDAIARAIEFAITQPSDVAVNEMIVRPTAQEL